MVIHKNIKTPLAIFFIVFLCMQFYRPKINEGKPSEMVIASVPKEINTILQKSCFDCHSNQTNLKWFDQIAPANWLVAGHVKKARNALNFSEWDAIPESQQNAKLWESVNHIILGEMPLKSYKMLHPHAKISTDDINILKEFVGRLAPKQIADSAKSQNLEEQFKSWVAARSENQSGQLPVDINGIVFMPDYKNWTPISTTQRFDNGTMRIIFGNDRAIKAISEHKTNPWPDGTIIAKAAWEQLKDENGNIQTGTFIQVEYMIKDKQKYKSTEGWGWARFKTPKLIPYGEKTNFTNECISCHQPMKNNDFVFTEPLKISQ